MIHTIEYKFTSLNKMINANRGNKYMGNAIKQRETEIVRLALLNKPPFNVPCKIKFTWLITNRRSDPDNLASAKKQVLDGMVKAKLIPDDTLKFITGFQDEFELGNINGVRIEVL